MGRAAPWIVLALAFAFPLAMQAEHQTYYLSFASRIFIYALAATSLNLILGYGGMISFGHAAFVGTGAYVSSIMLSEGVSSAWIGWPAAVAASSLAALVIGAVSLRTRGVYFIMITLAFAQMVFFLVNSMKAYGGDEGLSLRERASLGLGVDLGSDFAFYYAALAALAAGLYGLHRLAHSRFGRVIQAIRENEERAEAIGFPVYRCKLVCFVIAGAAGGLAGALLASHGKYVNPNVLHWTQSGTLMMMVIMGGAGRLWGGVIGAAALLGLEDLIANHRVDWLAAIFPNYQQHASLGVGTVLLAIVLLAPQGLAGREAVVVAALAHGEQRALEVGLALATRPRLVLLDEPMAGMGPEESENMIALLERIRARITVLLVEHDMDAVFRLADRVSVLVAGRVIASGAPAAIRVHPEVRKAYLGEDATA